MRRILCILVTLLLLPLSAFGQGRLRLASAVDQEIGRITGAGSPPPPYAERLRLIHALPLNLAPPAIERRTSMSRSGSASAMPDTVAYSYNDRSELTGAVSNADTAYSYTYAYDPIGNRVSASEAGVPWTDTANSLNHYTAATEGNAQLSFAYDLNGSMTHRPVDATSGWMQIWNAKNRMAETNKGTDRLTFQYGYMGRSVEKCVYSGNTLVSKTPHLRGMSIGPRPRCRLQR